MGWLQDWWDDGGIEGKGVGIAGTNRVLVKEDVLATVDTGQPLEVRLSMSLRATRDYAYTFYLECKEDPKVGWVDEDTWTITATNLRRAPSIFREIEQAYADKLSEYSSATGQAQPYTETVLREETKEGVTFTLMRADNVVGVPNNTVYMLRIKGGGRTIPYDYATLEAAEEGYVTMMKRWLADVTSQETRTFMGVTVYRTESKDNALVEDAPVSVSYFMQSESVPVAENANFGVGDMVGEFGPLDGLPEHDFGVFEQYIASVAAADAAQDGTTLELRWVPVPFTGWEDAFDMADTPFAKGSRIEDAEVRGDIVAMGKSSAVALYIREGYKVAIDVQASGLDGDDIGDMSVDFEAQLVGGDAFVFDMVPSPPVLSVMLNGVESSPYEGGKYGSSFLVKTQGAVRLLNVYRQEEVPQDAPPTEDKRKTEPDDDTPSEGGTITETAFANLGVIAIAGVVVLLFIGLLSRVGKKAAGGTQEATE